MGDFSEMFFQNVQVRLVTQAYHSNTVYLSNQMLEYNEFEVNYNLKTNTLAQQH